MSSSQEYWLDTAPFVDEDLPENLFLKFQPQNVLAALDAPSGSAIVSTFTQEFSSISDDALAAISSQMFCGLDDLEVTHDVTRPSLKRPTDRLSQISASSSRATSIVASGSSPKRARFSALQGDSEVTLVDSVIDHTDGNSAPQRSSEGLDPPASKRRKLEVAAHAKENYGSKLRNSEANATWIPEGYHNIAYSKQHQLLLDSRNIPWGAQWEIARLISNGRLEWGEVQPSILDSLVGSNTQVAAKVTGLFGNTLPSLAEEQISETYFSKERMTTDPFKELDREEALLSAQDPTRLGCQQDQFAGKVMQTARLLPSKTTPGLPDADVQRILAARAPHDRFRICLDPQSIGRSTRISRFYGSRRIIQLTVAKLFLDRSDLGVIDWLLNGMIICGRVFRAFYAKDKNVYLAEVIDHNIQREIPHPLDSTLMSLRSLVYWHNSLDENRNQTMSKWSSRMALALSTSAPAVTFAQNNIHGIPDIISASAVGSKPSSEHILTDGCGYVNWSALVKIAEALGLQSVPCAVQARLGGAKGMFMLHPLKCNPDAAPEVWIRDSQLKIQWCRTPDESKRILDIVRLAKATFPSRLSAESTVNLAENGVGFQVFSTLFKENLAAQLKPLTDWSDMKNLWKAVSLAGRISQERLRREDISLARAKRYGEDKEIDDVNTEEYAADSAPALYWPDEISGYPGTIYEQACWFLQSGFHPESNQILYEKLREIVKQVINAFAKKCRITVPASVEAFILPDPSPIPVLKEGEIFFKFGKPVVDPITGRDIDVVTGECVVGRHPTKLPTDMQKVTAVDVPELGRYTNVIIFPVLGERSLASLLGGGDYDGDTVTMIWDPAVVKPFTNADFSLSLPPAGLQDDFTFQAKGVIDFIKDSTDYSELKADQGLQRSLLGSLQDIQTVGMYSTFHDIAVYILGYTDLETRRLAHMFTTQLDGAKSGLKVKPEVKRRDETQWDKWETLEWKTNEDTKEKSFSSGINKISVPRRKTPFIMDYIRDVAKEESHRHLAAYAAMESKRTLDRDLEKPWLEAHDRMRGLATHALIDEKDHPRYRELEAIKSHVKGMRSAWIQSNLNLSLGPASPLKRPRQAKGASEQNRQEAIRKLSRAFHYSDTFEYMEYSPSEVRRLKASYAYVYDAAYRGGTRFPWEVAFRDLSYIKNEGRPASILSADFQHAMVVHSKILKSQ